MKYQRRVLIVDDERPARNAVRKLLVDHPEIVVAGEAGSVAEAIKLYNELGPDLIFLDVQMPKRDGFSLLPELSPVPDIIFTTAHDQHAVKAFEVNAMDFLVKPISPDRLSLSLLRLRKPPKREAQPFSAEVPIFLYADHEMCVVATNDITHIKAAHNYTKVHLSTRKPVMMLRRISEWKRLLPAEAFLALDRSTIINLSVMTDITTLPGFRSKVRFQGNQEELELGLFASRRLRKSLRTSALFSGRNSVTS